MVQLYNGTMVGCLYLKFAGFFVIKAQNLDIC